VGVPYRTAWYKIKGMEASLGIRLLDTQTGGADGGGSALTPEASALVSRFRHATAGIAGLIEARLRAELGELFED
jgi:molybdate transport system regulatory protein